MAQVSFTEEAKRLNVATTQDADEEVLGRVILNIDGTIFEEGDVIVMPTEYTGDQKIRMDLIKGSDGKTNKVPWVFVECIDKNGVHTPKRFMPGMLTKSRIEVDNDCNVTDRGFVRASGKASDEWKSHATVGEAFEALKGKKLVITKREMIQTLKFGSKNERTKTSICQVDFTE